MFGPQSMAAPPAPAPVQPAAAAVVPAAAPAGKPSMLPLILILAGLLLIGVIVIIVFALRK
jgi:hypothetical protein